MTRVHRKGVLAAEGFDGYFDAVQAFDDYYDEASERALSALPTPGLALSDAFPG